MIRVATLGVYLLLLLLVGGCGFSSILDSDPGSTGQPFPASYKTELLAFFRSYLSDPVAVRDAEMAEAVLRPIAGQPRYISCLRFNPHESDGSYRGARTRAVLFNNGRLDRVLDDLGDLCAGASYSRFPEMEKMSR